MEDHETIGLVRKSGVSTSIIQTESSLFSPTEKGNFKLAAEFNPERNELFFAKKVIIVEGLGDRYAMLGCARILGYDFDSLGISVIECGNRDNIPFFSRIICRYRIPFSVMYDADPESSESIMVIERIKSEIRNRPNLINECMLDPRQEATIGYDRHLQPMAVRSVVERLGREEVPDQRDYQ